MAETDKASERRRRFAVAYVDGLDPRQAALAAGYGARGAERHGQRLLADRRVVEAIARMARAAKDAAKPGATKPITRDWITRELTELYEMVKASLKAAGEAGGKPPTGAALQNVIRALGLLIKHLETDGLDEAGEAREPEPDLSKLDHEELRQLEAILARTRPGEGPARAGGAQPR